MISIYPTLLDELVHNKKRLFPALTEREADGCSLYEDDDHLYLEAEVPGIQRENIHVTVEKGVVLIEAESKEERKEDVKVHFQSTRHYSYRLVLPVRIDEQASPVATCKDGIVKVIFAKSRSAKPMKIAVS
jgi:HSP20 family protein